MNPISLSHPELLLRNLRDNVAQFLRLAKHGHVACVALDNLARPGARGERTLPVRRQGLVLGAEHIDARDRLPGAVENGVVPAGRRRRLDLGLPVRGRFVVQVVEKEVFRVIGPDLVAL